MRDTPPVNRYRRQLLGGLPAALLLGCGGASDTATLPPADADSSELRLTATVDLGLAYASSSVNTPSFREQSILRLSDGGHAVAYFDENGEATLALLSQAGELRGKVIVDPLLPARLLADGHCAINLGRSASGRVHLMHGAHGTNPTHAVIDEAALLADPLARRLTASAWPRLITYPQFYNPQGQLQLWFRSDPDNTVMQLEAASADGSLSGTPRAILSPDGDDRPYINQLAYRGDTLALSWMYRVPSTDGLVHNEGLYLAVSEDGGRTWRQRSGAALPLPITRAMVSPEIELPSKTRWPLNQTASCFAPDGTLFVSLHARDQKGLPQIQLMRCAIRGTEAPSVEVVSANDTAFELDGAGSLALPLSRPQVVASATQLHVLYRQSDSLVVASRRHGAAPGAWTRQTVPTVGLGAWEPSLCRETWDQQRTLLVYLQSVRQGVNDTAAPGPATQAQVLVFRPQAAAPA